jgi:ADP-ribose pyrophosphatase YjhB (NUDIX family)
VPAVKLRPSARAIILDEQDRILLCRFELEREGSPVVVWATPGGGVEPGETLLDALRRELREEVGLEVTGEPPHVWHREVIRAGHTEGYDGVINDFFLIRTAAFTPRGTMSDAELAAENVTGFRWWSHAELASHQGTDLFGPRDLAAGLAALLTGGLPAVPVRFGL